MSTPKPKNMVKIHVHNREKAKDFICRLFGRWSNESKLIYLIMILSYQHKKCQYFDIFPKYLSGHMRIGLSEPRTMPNSMFSFKTPMINNCPPSSGGMRAG